MAIDLLCFFEVQFIHRNEKSAGFYDSILDLVLTAPGFARVQFNDHMFVKFVGNFVKRISM